MSVENVGGRDADSSLHGCIDGVFRKICPKTVRIWQVLNSFTMAQHPNNCVQGSRVGICLSGLYEKGMFYQNLQGCIHASLQGES